MPRTPEQHADTQAETQLPHVTEGERIVVRGEEDFDLVGIFLQLWARKWVILTITTVFVMLAVVYSFAATRWYRADVLIAPVEAKTRSPVGAQLGGLASFVGLDIGGDEAEQYVATLRSRDFAREFIDERGLLELFFRRQLAEAESTDESTAPDLRDAVSFFHKRVFRVSEEPDSDLIRVSVEWQDPDLAAAWANEVVQEANNRLRLEALKEAETNVAYLREEMQETSILPLQQSIGRLLESELQKLMIARVKDEYAFRTIDPAVAPKDPSRPRSRLVVALAFVVGFFFSVFVTMLLSAFSRLERSPD